ncbi:hypothetical protein Rhein_0154 [Rheinheimera sp. A13L]|nr:hypothetical protein Rhein_0154 [Rheinheimera sp. A13L]
MMNVTRSKIKSEWVFIAVFFLIFLFYIAGKSLGSDFIIFMRSQGL